MRQKPKGKKYHHLVARGERVYWEHVFDGKTHRRSCRTDDWDVAALVRDQEFEPALQAGRLRSDSPTFAVCAARYLQKARDYLAASTYEDRCCHPAEEEG